MPGGVPGGTREKCSTRSFGSFVPVLLGAICLVAIHPTRPATGASRGGLERALPRLQGSDRSPLVATLILAVLVTIWYVPLFISDLSWGALYTGSWIRISENLLLRAWVNSLCWRCAGLRCVACSEALVREDTC